MKDNNFITEAQAAKKRRRRFRRRLRNRLALAISIALIITYTFDLGWDRRSDNLTVANTETLADRELVRQASNLKVTTFAKDGRKQLTVSTEYARLGSIGGLDIPPRIRDEVAPALTDLPDDSLEFSDFEQTAEGSGSMEPQAGETIAVAPLATANFVTLQPVSVFAFDGKEMTATLSASDALLDGIEETLWLDGNVVARNLIDKSSMQTQQISMHTKTRQFAGSAPVTLKFENSTTNAVGIQGTLVDRKWSLLSSVKTIIQPNVERSLETSQPDNGTGQ